VVVLVGDATKEQTLRAAHIERARGLVAATTTDATNLYIILTARALNPKLKINRAASEEDAEKHLLTAGADFIVSPYSFAGNASRKPSCARMWSAFLILRLPTWMDLEIGEICIGRDSGFVEDHRNPCLRQNMA